MSGGIILSEHAVAKSFIDNKIANSEEFTLAPLSYSYDALEPFIDKLTMEIHYSKHHQAYVTNLNKAIANTDAAALSIIELCNKISKYPIPVRNNAGGHFNHTFFWSILKVNNQQGPKGKVAELINKKFGTFESFKDEFTKAALGRFGSGWAWLVLDKSGSLMITSTPNQDNPIMDVVPENEKGTPIIGLDVWEHAYYLKYQNKRADYIAAFWNVVNWDKAEENLQTALKK
ncbi:MAG: superoxide dismutase [Bacteroidota bacterium]|nr:superoxide dismutase [Bacteroidota bacterium]